MQFTNPTAVPTSFTVSGGHVDNVTNPVSTDPASTVAIVSTSVPFLNRDAFFWPAISGESFPPTKNGGSAYTFSPENGTPCIAAAQSGGSPGQVTYPNLPRIGYNGKQTMVWDWYGWVQGATFPIAANSEQYYALLGTSLAGWATGFIYKANAGGTALNLYGRMGVAGNDFLIAAAEPLFTLRHFQVFLDANGTAEWWVDGVRKGQQAGWWPPIFSGQAVPSLQLNAVGNAAGIITATRVTAQWT